LASPEDRDDGKRPKEPGQSFEVPVTGDHAVSLP
jgi:hypothetical protein